MNAVKYQILMSIPRFAPVYSSGILAELGSVQAFPSNDAVAKYASIVWKENQSAVSRLKTHQSAKQVTLFALLPAKSCWKCPKTHSGI